MDIFNFDKQWLNIYVIIPIILFESFNLLKYYIFFKNVSISVNKNWMITLFINAVRNQGFLLVYKQILNITCTLNLYFSA